MKNSSIDWKTLVTEAAAKEPFTLPDQSTDDTVSLGRIFLPGIFGVDRRTGRESLEEELTRRKATELPLEGPVFSADDWKGNDMTGGEAAMEHRERVRSALHAGQAEARVRMMMLTRFEDFAEGGDMPNVSRIRREVVDSMGLSDEDEKAAEVMVEREVNTVVSSYMWDLVPQIRRKLTQTGLWSTVERELRDAKDSGDFTVRVEGDEAAETYVYARIADTLGYPEHGIASLKLEPVNILVDPATFDDTLVFSDGKTTERDLYEWLSKHSGDSDAMQRLLIADRNAIDLARDWVNGTDDAMDWWQIKTDPVARNDYEYELYAKGVIDDDHMLTLGHLAHDNNLASARRAPGLLRHEEAAFAAHLAECKGCRMEMEALDALFDFLDNEGLGPDVQ